MTDQSLPIKDIWPVLCAALNCIARDLSIFDPIVASVLDCGDQPALDQLNDRPRFDPQSVSGFECGHLFRPVCFREADCH